MSEKIEEDDRLAKRLADVDAYFELAREGEPVDLEAVVHIPFKAPERIREN